jgi:hypothetical protein
LPIGTAIGVRYGVDACVQGTARLDVRSEHPLPGADVEDPFAAGRLQQIKYGRDGQPLVICAALIADPAVIPGGDALPAS